MSGTWGDAKSYTKGCIETVSKVGGAVGGALGVTGAVTATTTTTTVTVTTGAASAGATTTIATGAAAVAPAVVAGSVGAAAGTLIGQGVCGVISWFWDPVTPVRTLDPSGLFVACSKWEAMTLLNRFYQWPFFNFLPWVYSTDPAFGGATADMLVVGVRTMIDATRGAACATAGRQDQVLIAKDVLQADIAEYSTKLGAFASALAMKPSWMDPLSLTAVQQWVSDCGTPQGPAFVPAAEAIFLQEMFNAAHVVWTGDDLGIKIASWCAEGLDAQEVSAFQNAGGSLAIHQLIQASRAFYWDRIDLDESPLVQ